jgi:hypothetical protein
LSDGPAIDGSDRLHTELTLSCLWSHSEVWGPIPLTFPQPQFVMQDVVHGAIRDPIGSRQIRAGHREVSLHLAVDTVQGPLNFFRIEVPLIVDVFSGRNFFDDVNRCVPLITCPQKQHQWLFLFHRSFFGFY